MICNPLAAITGFTSHLQRIYHFSFKGCQRTGKVPGTEMCKSGKKKGFER